MLPTLSLGPLLLTLPPLALMLAFWAGAWLASSPSAPWPEREGSGGVNLSVLENAIYLTLGVGLAGGRLAFAARYLEIYGSNPLSLLALDLHTLDPGGGLLLGALAGLIYLRRKGQPLWPALDRLAPLLATLLAGMGLANFLSGEAFGLPAGLPWAVFLWDAWRHPVQLYEAAAALLALGSCYLPQAIPSSLDLKNPGGSRRGGQIFLRTAALLAAGRLLLEPLRAESATWSGGVRAAQVIALALLLAALWGMKQRAGHGPVRPDGMGM